LRGNCHRNVNAAGSAQLLQAHPYRCFHAFRAHRIARRRLPACIPSDEGLLRSILVVCRIVHLEPTTCPTSLIHSLPGIASGRSSVRGACLLHTLTFSQAAYIFPFFSQKQLNSTAHEEGKLRCLTNALTYPTRRESLPEAKGIMNAADADQRLARV